MNNPINLLVAFVLFLVMNFAVAGDILRGLGFDVSKLLHNWRPLMGLLAVSLLFGAALFSYISKSGKKFLVEVKLLGGSMQGKSMELNLLAATEEEARTIAAQQAQNFLQSNGLPPTGFHVTRVEADNFGADIGSKVRAVFLTFVLVAGLGLTGYGGWKYFHAKPPVTTREYTGKVEHKDYANKRVSSYEYVEKTKDREGTLQLALGALYLVVGIAMIGTGGRK